MPTVPSLVNTGEYTLPPFYNENVANQQLQGGNLANQQATLANQMAGQKLPQEKQAFDAMMGLVNQFKGGFNQSNTGGAGTGTGGGLPGQTQLSFQQYYAPTSADASAAQSKAFALAKAQAGSEGQAAINGLAGQMAARGITGSGTQMRGIADRLAAATNPLAQTTAQQLQENVNMAQQNQQLAQQAAETAFQGGISQRGQDITAQTAQAQLAQQKQLAQQQMLQQALTGLMGNLNISY